MKRKRVITHENDAMKTVVTVTVSTKANHGLMRYEFDDFAKRRVDLVFRALSADFSPSDIKLK